MKFTQYDLGQLNAGAVVEVTLRGTEANVRLMDAPNLQSYRSGRRHTYYGGHYKQSPARIPVPRFGHWYVTVDLGGDAGSVSSAVRVL
jgi:hypothetical protein